MGTAEIIIVFSALMALIALVTIGIDWVGKPLKNRRFIPRMYRFDDEKLPVDEYGNIIGLERVQPRSVDSGPRSRPTRPARPLRTAPPTQAAPKRLRRAPAAPRPVAVVGAASAGSAFSDMVARTVPPASANRSGHDQIAGRGEQPAPAPSPGAWAPGMALDLSIGGAKPNLAVKAERFWQSAATVVDTGETHFDAEDRERMAAGKAPRRLNPRSGRLESMQLTGLRRASTPDGVRMLWPDEIVDPWSSS